MLCVARTFLSETSFAAIERLAFCCEYTKKPVPSSLWAFDKIGITLFAHFINRVLTIGYEKFIRQLAEYSAHSGLKQRTPAS